MKEQPLVYLLYSLAVIGEYIDKLMTTDEFAYRGKPYMTDSDAEPHLLDSNRPYYSVNRKLKNMLRYFAIIMLNGQDALKV